MKTWVNVWRSGDGYGNGDGDGYGDGDGDGYGDGYSNGNGYGGGYSYGNGYGGGFSPQWLIVGDHLANLAVEVLV